MRVIILVLVAAPAASVAYTPPPKLVMKWDASYNIHMANQGGAHHRQHGVEVSVELKSGGKLVATDTGIHANSDLRSTGFVTQTEAKWTNAWTGTWILAGDTLQLDLILGQRTCVKTSEATGYRTETLKCDPMPKRVQFACKTEQLVIDAWSGTPTKPILTKQTIDAWRCNAATPLTDTPSQWIFDKTGCLRVTSGMQGYGYENCRP